ncbi:GntR family transcriptional regulator [Sporosarcina aquimarina]|uniref:GntR family transcriptional regulator n=1 Tax=Sporosarcina aquimarina TaxID=114975 RepID=UPI00203A91E1|nr:GntR family transcriptional regulator [Sporosarcina aquimarina]MCM3758210.1 GntR family transcriptional regulator [Sporosarcina aquimarina]
MFIQIEATSDIPIYTQLANQVIELIARGQLQGGDTLPSVRALASDLSVNMHTVNKSYHELEQKGIIRIVPKSGAIINPIVQYGMSRENRQRIIERIRPILAESLVLGMSLEEIEQLVSATLSLLKED